MRILANMWLKCEWIGKTVSEKGRIPVKFADGTKYSLRISQIEKIVEVHYPGAVGYVYYVLYKTSHPEFYEKWSEEPDGGYQSEYVVEAYKVPTCPVCGWEIEDLEYEECPRCGAPLYKPKYITRLILSKP